MNDKTPIEQMAGELTREQAVALSTSGWWDHVPLAAATTAQLHQERLCMPFPVFHKGMEQLLGRPVWTHEFANQARLIAESEGKRAAPSDPISSLIEVMGGKPLPEIIVVETGNGRGES